MNSLEQQIAELERKLQALDAERAVLAQALATLRQQRLEQIESFAQRVAEAAVTHHSSRQDKIKLFRNLFKGREDVYPKRFESSKTGKSGYSPVCLNEWHPKLCHKPRIKCGDCQYQAYQPLSDAVIANHLMGMGNPAKPHENFVVGVYPLLLDERCWFLAVDFDKASWQQDILAFSAACKAENIPYCKLDYSGWPRFRIPSFIKPRPCVYRPSAFRESFRVRNCFPNTLPCRVAVWKNCSRC